MRRHLWERVRELDHTPKFPVDDTEPTEVAVERDHSLRLTRVHPDTDQAGLTHRVEYLRQRGVDDCETHRLLAPTGTQP